MKKYILENFAGYVIFDNGTVTHADGSPVEQTAKDKESGVVRLEASEDQPVSDTYKKGLVKGNKYGFKIASLVDMPGANWTEVAGEGAPIVKTEAELAKEAYKAQRKALQKTADDLEKAAKNETDPAKAFELFQQWKAIGAQLAEMKAPKADKPVREYTPEEQAQIDAYVAKVANVDALKLALKTAKEELAAMEVPNDYKRSGTGGEFPSRGAHVGYENAQEIRRLYAIGRFGNPGTAMSAKEIADRFGCAPSAVNYYAHYLQHKLRKGDIEHTPRINKFYPAELWPEGAPYAEDGVKETQERYKLPDSRKGDIRALSANNEDVAGDDAGEGAAE